MNVLSEQAIRERAPGGVNKRIGVLDVVDSVGSTNSELLSAPPPPVGGWRVLIAREQRGGRGRSGNDWQSPRNGGLWMSAATSFAGNTAITGALTLATGVAVAEVLENLGVAGIRLKWPNDLIVDDAKLGGILVEMKSAGRAVVIGIGINLRPIDAGRLDDSRALPPTCLDAVMEGPPDPSALAAALLARVTDAVPQFLEQGLAAFSKAWSRYDWLRGRSVSVAGIDPEVAGVASGISDDGSLVIRSGDARVCVASGTVRTVGSDN